MTYGRILERKEEGPSHDSLDARRPTAARGVEPTLLFLQQSAGNRAVSELVGGGVQRSPGPKVRERVLESTSSDDTRTVAVIHVTAHASPRWRGAATAGEKDLLNARLSARRGMAIRAEVEGQLRELMPDRQLTFEYDYMPEDPTRETADVVIGGEDRGSRDTLLEAGPRGRAANDPGMRRVDVRVDLHSATETEVDELVELKRKKSAATTRWSIWVAGQAGASIVGKAGWIVVQLKNRDTDVVGTYHGHFGGVGAEVGVDIAKTSAPDFVAFSTKVPMSFADFDFSEFSITGFGISLGIGAEYSKFKFERFMGGEPTPRGVQVGGVSMGGIGISFGSVQYGTLYMQGHPTETRDVTTWERRSSTFRSEKQERSEHRVHFSTESASVTRDEAARLGAYLAGVSEPWR